MYWDIYNRETYKVSMYRRSLRHDFCMYKFQDLDLDNGTK